MRRHIVRTVLGLALALAALAAATMTETRSQPRGPLPWCEYGGFTRNGIGNCSYYTFAQCLEAARGDGTCERNPRFDQYYFLRGIPAPQDIDPNGRPIGPQRRR
jgi:hypothetical protein